MEKTDKGKLNFSQFKCKLVGEIKLEEDGKKEINQASKIGHAWSGINVAVGSKQQAFLYGTDNGQIVRLQFVESNGIKTCEENKDPKNLMDSIQTYKRKSFTYTQYEMQMESREVNIKQLVKDEEDDDKIIIEIEDSDQLEEENSNNNQIEQFSTQYYDQLSRQQGTNSLPSINGSPIFHIKIDIQRFLECKEVCFQVAQINDYTFISGKSQTGYFLSLFDMDGNQVDEIKHSVASYHFTRSSKLLVYRQADTWDSHPSLVVCTVSSGKIKIRKVVVMKDKECFPTALLAFEGFLFVGLYTQRIQLYNLRTMNLISVFAPDMNSYPKKLAVAAKGTILAIITLKDQILILNTPTNTLLSSFSLQEVFEIGKLDFKQMYEVYLFTFLDPEILVIGGSFKNLFFFEWRTKKLRQVYQGLDSFVGIFFHSNKIYLTHEKKTSITILE